MVATDMLHHDIGAVSKQNARDSFANSKRMAISTKSFAFFLVFTPARSTFQAELRTTIPMDWITDRFIPSAMDP